MIFESKHPIEGEVMYLDNKATIEAVRFTKSKVTYDLIVKNELIREVDSCDVNDIFIIEE